jgi:hypothetical protein
VPLCDRFCSDNGIQDQNEPRHLVGGKTPIPTTLTTVTKQLFASLQEEVGNNHR